MICCDFCTKSFHSDCYKCTPDTLPNPWKCYVCIEANGPSEYEILRMQKVERNNTRLGLLGLTLPPMNNHMMGLTVPPTKNQMRLWSKDEDLLLFQSLDASMESIWVGSLYRSQFISAAERIGRSVDTCRQRWSKIRSSFLGITDTAIARIETQSNEENIPIDFRLINFVYRKRKFLFEC